jgi:rhodanese-related sulfurtransferase
MTPAVSSSAAADRPSGGLLRGIVAICVTGIALGLSYNWFGLESPRRWGLPWIAEDRIAALEAMPSITATDAAAGKATDDDADPYFTDTTDPFAIAVDTSAALPQIPSMERPVAIELDAVELYVEAGAALIIDARDRVEYVEGHIPGAINLPYDTIITDPEALSTLDTAGRPIIAYCGGGECEVSLTLAYELIALGYDRVAVYMGGYPEWEQAGLPIARAEGGE